VGAARSGRQGDEGVGTVRRSGRAMADQGDSLLPMLTASNSEQLHEHTSNYNSSSSNSSVMKGYSNIASVVVIHVVVVGLVVVVVVVVVVCCL